jgi:hypothetical protein
LSASANIEKFYFAVKAMNNRNTLGLVSRTYLFAQETTHRLFSHLSLLRMDWLTVGIGSSSLFFYLLTILVFQSRKNLPGDLLTRDPVAIAQIPSYYGAFSQVGVLLWTAAAAMCLLSSRMLSKYFDSGKMRRFLWFSGLLTLLLAIDDAFLLHEDVLPFRGIPENLVLLTYFILIILYLIKFSSLILTTEYVFLSMAFLCFGGSILFDVIVEGLGVTVIEDGLKLTGIVYWITYFYRTALAAIGRAGNTNSETLS